MDADGRAPCYTPAMDTKLVVDVTAALDTDDGDNELFHFRIPNRTIARVDRYLERLAQEVPGVRRAGRTGAIRALVTRALNDVEKQSAE